jgi:U3 small nucleolar RNA-associated protein 23
VIRPFKQRRGYVCFTSIFLNQKLTFEQTEEQKLHASAPDLALVGTSAAVQEEKFKKRKGPKGPNPLSVKKKKTTDMSKPSTQKKPPATDEKVKAGTKRKAEQSGDEGDHQANEEPLNLESQTGGTHSSSKKRKRRRKANTGDQSQGAQDASDVV